jgi:ASC-1-like (ASCH) protein
MLRFHHMGGWHMTTPVRTKVLWVKEEHILDILSGRKTVEVRVAYPNIARLEPGDILLLNERYPYAITGVRRYASFREMAASEDHSAIAPDLPDQSALLAACRALYPADKEEMGVVALEITPQKRAGETCHRDADCAPLARDCAGRGMEGHDGIPCGP